MYPRKYVKRQDGRMLMGPFICDFKLHLCLVEQDERSRSELSQFEELFTKPKSETGPHRRSDSKGSASSVID